MTTQPVTLLERLRERKWAYWEVARMSDGELSVIEHDGNPDVRALLDIAEAAQRRNPCAFCDSRATGVGHTHLDWCPLAFLDAADSEVAE